MPTAETRQRDSNDTTDLLHRTSGGLDVTLLWDRTTRSLTLELVDHSLRRIVDFDVPPERASYVFHHPFAYAYEQPQRHRLHAA
jgi:hypothetical protein